MSGCPICWDNPCVCGADYRHLSSEALQKLIETLSGIIAERKTTLGHPVNAKNWWPITKDPTLSSLDDTDILEAL